MMLQDRYPLTLISACGTAQRLVGLIGQPPPAWHTGLYFAHCRSVHTCFMRYAIDVVFIDAEGRIIKKIVRLPPWRCALCRAAHAVIELPGGYCDALADMDARVMAAVANVRDADRLPA